MAWIQTIEDYHLVDQDYNTVKEEIIAACNMKREFVEFDLTEEKQKIFFRIDKIVDVTPK